MQDFDDKILYHNFNDKNDMKAMFHSFHVIFDLLLALTII